MWKVAPYFSVPRLRTLVTVLFMFAIACLVLLVVLGFEEPNKTLLLLSSSLLLAAIVAVFAHLVVTDELNRSEKRFWLAQLAGRRAPWAWSDTSPATICGPQPSRSRRNRRVLVV